MMANFFPDHPTEFVVSVGPRARARPAKLKTLQELRSVEWMAQPQAGPNAHQG
jgi:hypothetical protein